MKIFVYYAAILVPQFAFWDLDDFVAFFDPAAALIVSLPSAAALYCAIDKRHLRWWAAILAGLLGGVLSTLTSVHQIALHNESLENVGEAIALASQTTSYGVLLALCLAPIAIKSVPKKPPLQ